MILDLRARRSQVVLERSAIATTASSATSRRKRLRPLPSSEPSRLCATLAAIARLYDHDGLTPMAKGVASSEASLSAPVRRMTKMKPRFALFSSLTLLTFACGSPRIIGSDGGPMGSGGAGGSGAGGAVGTGGAAGAGGKASGGSAGGGTAGTAGIAGATGMGGAAGAAGASAGNGGAGARPVPLGQVERPVPAELVAQVLAHRLARRLPTATPAAARVA